MPTIGISQRCGMRAARESVRWPLVDQGGGRYDFSSIDPFLEAARREGMEVIWDLFHYGYPRGLDLLGSAFPDRFADYCHAVARHIGARTEGPCYFTPINEPSFMAFAGGRCGAVRPPSPRARMGAEDRALPRRHRRRSMPSGRPARQRANGQCGSAVPRGRPPEGKARGSGGGRPFQRACGLRVLGHACRTATPGAWRLSARISISSESITTGPTSGNGASAACRRAHPAARR